MSSYNSIIKLKYTDNLSDAVSLEEYIMFADEKRERKYIVFKFSNNVNQNLFGIKFEVSQYDMHNELIEKSVVLYKDFTAKPNSTFVPKARLKANYTCKRISVRLIQAAFDRVLWNEGEFVDNSYKFEHFARDEKYIEEKDRPVRRKTASPVRRGAGATATRFSVKNITKKNIARGPAVFYWIFCILIIIGIGVSLFLFRRVSKVFTLQGYDLQIVDGSSVRICGYEGEEEIIVVPSHIDNYTVVRIGKNAFSRLKAKSVKLPESVKMIETGAFNRMEKLQSVQLTSRVLSSYTVEVQYKAFEKCAELTAFNIPGAELSRNSLYGCSKVSTIIFGYTKESALVDIFGETKHSATIRFFSGDFDSAEAEFFDGVKLSDSLNQQ